MTTIEKLFRINDIRGDAQRELSYDTVQLMGRAIGTYAQENGVSKMIVARDTRASSPLLTKALIEGLLHTGCNVIDIGEAPSPLLYFATQELGTNSGIMVTASHNPASDNGLKIVFKGDAFEPAPILTTLQTAHFQKGRGVLETKSIIPLYEEKIAQDIHLERPLRVVVDAGTGVVGKVFPQLAKKLGVQVIERNSPCFVNPALPKPLAPLVQEVVRESADLGVAFDSDGDRVGIVTNKGHIIASDRLLMLFAESVLAKIPGATIIYDVKCSRFLEPWIKQCHGAPLMWKTGHSLIVKKMRETGARLAGELSGHFYFKDRFSGFDDGLYAALRLMEILSRSTLTLDDICSRLPNSVSTPELKIDMADEKKFAFIEKFNNETTFPGGKLNTLDGVRVDFAHGFGLVRASNTTPSLVLRFEADTTQELKKIQELFRKKLLSIEPSLKLPF